MTVELLSLVENALCVAKQALGSHAGRPESGGLPRETHIVAHCVRKEERHSYSELVDRLRPDCQRHSHLYAIKSDCQVYALRSVSVFFGIV